MIAGVYFVLALGKGGDMSNVWNVALAGIPFGLSVASINVGKHIDKMTDDKAKGVGTFPVRVGQTFARYVNIAAIVTGLCGGDLPRRYRILLHRDAIGLVRGPARLVCCDGFVQAAPGRPAQGFRSLLAHLVLGLLFLSQPHVRRSFHPGRFARYVVPQSIRWSLPLSTNWLGAIVLGVGVIYAVVKMQMDKAKKA